VKLSSISAIIPHHVCWNFKQKLDFYELSQDNVINFLLVKFINGEFDKELELPGVEE
jgi:hypothetical protein